MLPRAGKRAAEPLAPYPIFLVAWLLCGLDKQSEAFASLNAAGELDPASLQAEELDAQLGIVGIFGLLRALASVFVALGNTHTKLAEHSTFLLRLTTTEVLERPGYATAIQTRGSGAMTRWYRAARDGYALSDTRHAQRTSAQQKSNEICEPHSAASMSRRELFSKTRQIRFMAAG
jgi:hypothetical protein